MSAVATRGDQRRACRRRSWRDQPRSARRRARRRRRRPARRALRSRGRLTGRCCRVAWIRAISAPPGFHGGRSGTRVRIACHGSTQRVTILAASIQACVRVTGWRHNSRDAAESILAHTGEAGPRGVAIRTSPTPAKAKTHDVACSVGRQAARWPRRANGPGWRCPPATARRRPGVLKAPSSSAPRSTVGRRSRT
jgi:hypothetical protein